MSIDMRIKLVNPPVLGLKGHCSVIYLPQGLGILAAFLRNNDIYVNLEDLNARLRGDVTNYRFRRLLKEVHMVSHHIRTTGYYTGISNEQNNILAGKLLDLMTIEEYDIIGIRINSLFQALPAFLLAEKIKKESGKPIVIGGPYVTLYAQLFFERYDFIDFAIVGHGEVPLLKLVHYLNKKERVQDVPSLWYRDRSQNIFTGRKFYNIETQPCPDFDGLSLQLYKKFNKLTMPYSISRGCVSKCSFCIYGNIDGGWQCKSVEKVIKDVTFIKEKYKPDLFFFEDTNFNMSYKYVEELCDGFIKAGFCIPWIARVQPRNIDNKLISKMKQAGCHKLEWGIESGSDKIQESIGKKPDQQKQVEILRMAKEVGIINCIYLMVNYPYEMTDDLGKTALLLKNNAYLIDEVIIYDLYIFYGSDLFNNPEKYKIRIVKEKHSFFSYSYSFEETKREKSLIYNKKLKRMRGKIIDYNFRYILSKKSHFPYNIMLRLFGFTFQRSIIKLLSKIYFSEKLNKSVFVKNIISDWGIMMRRFSFFRF